MIRQHLFKAFSLIPSHQKKVFSILFFSIFVMVSGVGIVVPLLPIYATNLGASAVYVSMIFASFSLSRTILLPFFGRWSDKKGRKPFILLGLICYVLVSIALFVSDSVNELIFSRFLQGIGSAMIFPVAQAYVGEITNKGSEGYSMGLFNLSMFISLSIGPALGGVIQDIWSMEAAFATMGVLSFLALILCFFGLPPVLEEFIPSRDKDTSSWKMILRDWQIWGLCMFRYAYTAGIGIIWCFLPLLADQNFSLSGSQIGILVSFGVFFSGILQVPMGFVADRTNKMVLICLGGFVAAAGMAGLFIAWDFFTLLAAIGLFGLGGGISTPALTAVFVEKGEQQQAMGSVMAMMTTAHSLGMLTGSLGAGAAVMVFPLEFVFPGAGCFMALGTACFMVISLVQRNKL